MEMHDYIKFFAALIFVLCLMGGLSYVLKRFNLGGGGIISPSKKRLKIVEILPLEARRKAVLIACDDKEHLVILGASGETVVETDINAAAHKNEPAKKATITKAKKKTAKSTKSKKSTSA